MKNKASDCMTFGQRIVYARKQKRLNQKQFAELIGVRPNRLCSWEKGTFSPAASTRESIIRKIARALEVPEDWLMGNDDNFSMKILPKNPQYIKLTKEQQQFVADNVKIIGATFKRFVRKYHLTWDSYDDFYGDAAIGLCEAAKDYDKSKGMSFFSFAFNCIEWEVKMDYRKSKKNLQPSISLDQVVGIGDDELGSLVPAPDEWEPLEYKILAESVYQKVECVLTAKEKEIFRPWLHGKEGSEIAREMGFKKCTVNQKIRNAKKKCQTLFNPDEIFTV